jgi:putative transposase
MERFKDIYRIPSARAQWWDYSRNGIYFITICTSGHDLYFGQILNELMILSNIGELVREEWGKSFKIRKELFCDSFVIMPNHIHAILRIDNQDTTFQSSKNKTTIDSENNNLMRRPKSISSFMAGFKSAVTTKATKMNSCFGWQSRFYDHIVRNEEEYQKIDNYIRNNPRNWKEDKLFKNQ